MSIHFVTMATRYPEETQSIEYSQAEIDYFVQQLERTGRYDVRRKESAPVTPTFGSVTSVTADTSKPTMVFGTPTPEREAARLSLGLDRRVSFNPRLVSAPKEEIVQFPQHSYAASQHSPTQHVTYTTYTDTRLKEVDTGSIHEPVYSKTFHPRPSLPTSVSFVSGLRNVDHPPYMSTPLHLTQHSTHLAQHTPSSLSTPTHSAYSVPVHTPIVSLAQGFTVPSTSVPSLVTPSYRDSYQMLHSLPGSRIPSIPPFPGEGVDSDFDIWKYDVTCLLQEGVYPQYSILEAIRKSLKGKARSVLFHLGARASVQDIITELEGIYGNVSSAENLKEMFYNARQKEKESIADYSLRLEQLLCKSDLHIDEQQKNAMLCSKLWSGLHDHSLKNITRFKFETVKDFSQLRRELRQVEQELGNTHVLSPPSVSSTHTSLPAEEASSHMSLVESKMLKQLESLASDMKGLSSRLEKIESDMKQSDTDTSYGDRNRNTPKWKNYYSDRNSETKSQSEDRSKGRGRDRNRGRSQDWKQQEVNKGEDSERQKPLNSRGPPRKGR